MGVKLSLSSELLGARRRKQTCSETEAEARRKPVFRMGVLHQEDGLAEGRWAQEMCKP